MSVDQSKTLIVKISSSILVHPDGKLDETRVADLVDDIMTVRKRGYLVVMVTSGAVAAGRSYKIERNFTKAQEAHFRAAIGQVALMRLYTDLFQPYEQTIGQMLLTREEFANRNQYNSIKSTIECLLANGVIPIVNDNDILHQEKSNFSDNDQLAACLGGMIDAQTVIFLSSVNGIYRNFNDPEQRELVPIIDGQFQEIGDSITKERIGKGGMKSKLNSAKLLYDLGIESYIASGREPGVVLKILEGTHACTHIIPQERKKISGVRKWLCTGAISNGKLTVSPIGAEVMRKKATRGSLLSIGVESVEGNFVKGDVVRVYDPHKQFLGYGITRYSSERIAELQGTPGTTIIHADYFYGTDQDYFLH